MGEILILGGLLLDRYFVLDQYPDRSGDALILDQFDRVGGSAINMAKTIDNLGGRGYLVSSLGTDAQGDQVLAYMKEEGFALDCLGTRAGNTGYCLVFLEPDGERTFMTSKGIEGHFSRDLLAREVEEACQAILLTGYYLLDETSWEVVDYLQEAVARGKRLIFDPSPLVEKIEPKILKRVLDLSQVMTPNREEAHFLAGTEAIEDWALAESRKGKTVLVKDGSRGGLLYEEGQVSGYEALALEAIDTTGAGDSFAGGLAYGLSKGLPTDQAVRLASACAALTVTIKGPHGDFGLENLPLEIRTFFV